MKNTICILLCFSLFLSGCGGQAANPVDRYMPGDENKSCKSLYAEIAEIDGDIAEHKQQIKNRDTWNVVLFVGGFVLIVPWFFMDVKNSQEVEIEAFDARKKALINLFHDKNCKASLK